MGVHGLTSFIDENNHLLTDLELHNCKIIIDGNNLYHFLYYYFKIPTQYAGDYRQYERSTWYFFRTLKACGIHPYVVFDGALDEEQRKLGTTLQRAKNRLNSAESLSQGRDAKMLPVLAFETFRQVLNELGIPHVTCDFEADNHVAALAHCWKCPVLTNDSDFFIYDLKGGYIVLDYLNLELHRRDTSNGEEGHNFLKVQIYYFEAFLSQFSGMDRKLVPLFATLLGNDFVPAKTFEVFYCGVKLPKPSSDRLFTSRRFAKIAGLLQWLGNMEAYDNAVGKILEHFACAKRRHIEEVIDRCVKTYTELNTNLDEYFKGAQHKEDSSSSELKSFGGIPLPRWFISRARQGEMSVLIMNSVVHRKVILSSQVERMTDPSSYLCARSIRSALYGILVGFDCKDLKTHSLSVEEYDRVRKNLEKSQVDAVLELPSGVTLPGLLEIPSMSTSARATVLTNVLGVNEQVQGSMSADLNLILMITAFWANNCSPQIKDIHVMAILLSLLYFWPIYELTCKEDHSLPKVSVDVYPLKPSEFVAGISARCSKDDLEKASATLQRFENTPKHSRQCLFDCSIVHVYSQFQACFLAVIYLNQVLCSPYTYPNPSCICSGSFFYNAVRELKSHRSPGSYIKELLKSCPSVLEYYCHLYSTMCQALPSNIFTRRKKKKKKKKTQDKTADTSPEDTDSSDGDSPSYRVAWDSSNRFGCLNLEQ